MLANTAWPTYLIGSAFMDWPWVLIPSLLIEALAIGLIGKRFEAKASAGSERTVRRIRPFEAVWLSIIANAASALVGCTVIIWAPPFFMLPGIPAVLAHYGATVLTELGVLRLLRVSVTGKLWLAFGLANILSYAILMFVVAES